MQFYIPAAVALMVAGVMAAPGSAPATLEARRTCVGGAIVCSYNNGGRCIVPCIFKCRCPPDWDGGHNSASGCGIMSDRMGSSESIGHPRLY
ncbi:hypothetical protein QIS74_01161 [Colletotrichum tabaci]|uniref:Uncharacterized protein n=1 Tax=Colletotrichum tabaci TaxID=1209068 RepID=A0AAV9TVQ3_9PEZI